MQRRNNGIIIVSLLLCAVIIFLTAGYIRFYKVPDKEYVLIELEKVNKEDTVMLNAGSKQIYVTKGVNGIVVLGSDGKIFASKDNGNYEEIYITGNFPEKINERLDKSIFVLNGEYIGRKTVMGVGPALKTFEVLNWNVLDETDLNQKNVSKTYLTKSDYFGSLKMSTDKKELYDSVDK